MYWQSPNNTTVETIIEYQYEEVKMYTNDGTPFTALLATSKTITITRDANGTIIDKVEVDGIKQDGFEEISDCHGHTFAEDKIWIDNSEVKTILEHDGYTEVTSQDDATIVVFYADKDNPKTQTKTGDIIHSSKKEPDGTYSSDAGTFSLKTGLNLEQAAGGTFDPSAPTINTEGCETMTDVSDSKNYKHYQSSGDKTVDSLSGGKKAGQNGGLAEYSEKDVKNSLTK